MRHTKTKLPKDPAFHACNVRHHGLMSDLEDILTDGRQFILQGNNEKAEAAWMEARIIVGQISNMWTSYKQEEDNA